MGKRVAHEKAGDVDVRCDPYGETAKERKKYDCPGCGADVFYTTVPSRWKKAKCGCGRERPGIKK